MFPIVREVAVLLTAQAAPTGPGGCTDASSMIPFVVMIGILYFVMIVPAKRDKKNHQLMLENLKRGDEVVTTSGMLGTISDMTGAVITLEIAKNVKVRLLKSAISKKVDEAKAAKEAEGKEAKAAASKDLETKAKT